MDLGDLLTLCVCVCELDDLGGSWRGEWSASALVLSLCIESLSSSPHTLPPCPSFHSCPTAAAAWPAALGVMEEFFQDGFMGLVLPQGGKHKAGSRILIGGLGAWASIFKRQRRLSKSCAVSAPQGEVLDLPLLFCSGLFWVPGKDGLGEGPW